MFRLKADLNTAQLLDSASSTDSTDSLRIGVSSPIENLQWKNPGMSSPPQRDKYLTVDQLRAQTNIYQYLVLTNDLDKAGYVMDVGCGSGNSTYALYSKGNQNCYFLGVDTSENIEFATSKYIPHATTNNLNYQAVSSPFDLPTTPPGSQGWDIITALAFFSWIPLEAQTAVLRGMHNILAEDGKILIRTQAVQDCPYRRAANEIMQEPMWSPYFEDYVSAYEDQTAEQMAQFLRDAGFVDVHTSFYQDFFSFPTKEAMITYFLQWLPQLSAIKSKNNDDIETKILRISFTTDVINRYCIHTKSTGIDIRLDFPCILATARKAKNQAPFMRIKV